MILNAPVAMEHSESCDGCSLEYFCYSTLLLAADNVLTVLDAYV